MSEELKELMSLVLNKRLAKSPPKKILYRIFNDISLKLHYGRFKTWEVMVENLARYLVLNEDIQLAKLRLLDSSVADQLELVGFFWMRRYLESKFFIPLLRGYFFEELNTVGCSATFELLLKFSKRDDIASFLLKDLEACTPWMMWLFHFHPIHVTHVTGETPYFTYKRFNTLPLFP